MGLHAVSTSVKFEHLLPSSNPFNMKSLLSIILSGSMLVLSVVSSAQTKSVISANDKAAINNIFRKNLDASQYRMEFGNNEAYGLYTLPNPFLEALRRGSHIDIDIVATSDLYKSYQPRWAFWFCIKRMSSSVTLERLLGKADAEKFQAIVKKYSGGQ